MLILVYIPVTYKILNMLKKSFFRYLALNLSNLKINKLNVSVLFLNKNNLRIDFSNNKKCQYYISKPVFFKTRIKDIDGKR